MLRFSLREGIRQIKSIVEVFKNGMPQAMYFIMSILKYYILNAFIQQTLGADNMAIYAVCINSVNIVRLCIEGVIGVVQTIGGVLFGEKDYYGIRRLVRRTVIFCCAAVAALTALFSECSLTMVCYTSQKLTTMRFLLEKTSLEKINTLI